MNRRGFFSSFSKFAIGLLAAPVIVREAMRVPVSYNGIYEQLQECSTTCERLDLNEMLKSLYAIKRKRKEGSRPEFVNTLVGA